MNVYTVAITEKPQQGKRKAYQARLIVQAADATCAEAAALKAALIQVDQVAELTVEPVDSPIIWTATTMVNVRA